MLHGCNRNQWLSVLLSLVLAWPQTGFAHSQHQPAAKDGDGALLQKVTINGQEVWVVAAAVDPKDEAEAVRKTGRTGGTLMISGADDPALKVARDLQEWSTMSIAVAKPAEQIEIPSSVPQSVRQKIVSRINAITEFCKHEKKGLMFALFNSSLMTGLSIYNSMSVPKGVATMAVTFAWVAFLMTSHQTWGKVMDAGAGAFRGLGRKVAGVFGKHLNPHDKKLFELTGKFVVSWIPNAMVAATVLWGANHLHLDHLWGTFIQAAWYGLLLNYNIWDAAFLPKVERGELSEQFWKNYITIQVLFGSVLELTSYMGFNQSQNILGAAVVSGVIYLAAQDKIEETVVPRARSIGRFVANQKKNCENALALVTTPRLARETAPAPHRFALWDDVQ